MQVIGDTESGNTGQFSSSVPFGSQFANAATRCSEMEDQMKVKPILG